MIPLLMTLQSGTLLERAPWLTVSMHWSLDGRRMTYWHWDQPGLLHARQQSSFLASTGLGSSMSRLTMAFRFVYPPLCKSSLVLKWIFIFLFLELLELYFNFYSRSNSHRWVKLSVNVVLVIICVIKTALTFDLVKQ
jgi:hypothetical protein